MKICDLCEREVDELIPLTETGREIFIGKKDCCKKCLRKMERAQDENKIESEIRLRKRLRYIFNIER